jgi:hypothetical protein
VNTFLFPFDAVLLSRLTLALSDGPHSPRQTAIMVIMQASACACFQPGLNMFLLAAGLVLTTIAAGIVERRGALSYLIRLLLLLLHAGFIWGAATLGSGLPFHTLTESALTALSGMMRPTTVLINVAGFLIVTNEGTTIIRLLFQIFGLVPGQADSPVDKTEYGAGRLIGILERAILYLLVLLNQFGALGFIIAAKSFARFKELEDRRFAEYMLIGTLASSLVALVCGLVVAALK